MEFIWLVEVGLCIGKGGLSFLVGFCLGCKCKEGNGYECCKFIY